MNKATSKKNKSAGKTRNIELEFDDDDFVDGDFIGEDFEEVETLVPTFAAGQLTARREIERRREELALLQALEDFPDYRILN